MAVVLYVCVCVCICLSTGQVCLSVIALATCIIGLFQAIKIKTDDLIDSEEVISLS